MVILCRISKLCFNVFLLKSRYLYFNLVSSRAVVVSLISKGTSRDLLSISISSTISSISPVAIKLFTLLLLLIIPLAHNTYSLLMFIAVS